MQWRSVGVGFVGNQVVMKRCVLHQYHSASAQYCGAFIGYGQCLCIKYSVIILCDNGTPFLPVVTPQHVWAVG